MTRRARRKAAGTVSAQAATDPRGPDQGTPQRRAKGLGVVTGADLVARSVSLHDVLLRKKLIDQTWHDAAEQYRRDYELAAGAREAGAAGGGTAPWNRTPGQAQVNALSRLRRADHVLGLDMQLFVDAVVHGAALMTLALRYGGADRGPGSRGSRAGRRIGQRFGEALERLERHYFGVSKGVAA